MKAVQPTWLLEARNVRVTVPASGAGSGPRRALVDGATLAVGHGEVVGLIGESGSGKTSLVRCLMDLLSPPAALSEGTLMFRGREYFGPGVDRRRSLRGSGIGMVFQSATRSLNPVLKVKAQLHEAIQQGQEERISRRETRIAVYTALREVALRDVERVANAYPHELSGGMRQRVSIALALARRPALLIADECTSALDVTTQAVVVELLRRVQAEFDLSLLFVTHDLLLAADICDRLVVMSEGRVIEDGPVGSVTSDPRHPDTKALLEATPGWGGESPSEGRSVPKADGSRRSVSAVSDVGRGSASRTPLLGGESDAASVQGPAAAPGNASSEVASPQPLDR
jgi:peptide/nickel transport system ATP-binding protein